LPSISLCMIVKNEEDTLARCLSSVVNFVDEIIIVDTGSTDRTKEIARPFTSDIYDFAWIDDFAAARNYAFSQATMEYILWLDADDFLREKDRSNLAKLKHTLDPSVDSVTMEYHLDHDEYGNVTVKNRRNRLVKRSNSFRWIGRVHEYLEVWGHIINSDVAVTHASMIMTGIGISPFMKMRCSAVKLFHRGTCTITQTNCKIMHVMRKPFNFTNDFLKLVRGGSRTICLLAERWLTATTHLETSSSN
jgi:glycosyltransferase involved in cell wall biosynthesis